MSVIHFKFKSAKVSDAVSFPGSSMRLIDLKKAIVEKKKLSKGLDFELVITDATTSKEYLNDNDQLLKNTSVLVKRVPSRNNNGLLERLKQEAQAAALANAPTLTVLPTSNPDPSIASAEGGPSGPVETMEDEMAALQSISKQAEDMRGTRGGNRTWTSTSGGGRPLNRPVRAVAPRGFPKPAVAPAGAAGGPMQHANAFTEAPPDDYVCFRCGTPGHYIQHCPTNGDVAFDNIRVKKRTGIPKTFMKIVDRSQIKGASGMTVVAVPGGGLAVVQAQSKDFSKLLEKAGGSATLDQLRLNPPAHLACIMCTRLIHDAVMIPCCQESACDECLRSALISHNMRCPLCKTSNMSPERLLPNKVVRASVDEFLRTSRTQQKDRDKIVKETEEKIKAKQLAAEEAAEAVEKQSADAMLDIKANDDFDEFGGDIFETAKPVESTPVASPVYSSPEEKQPEDVPVDNQSGTDPASTAAAAAPNNSGTSTTTTTQEWTGTNVNPNMYAPPRGQYNATNWGPRGPPPRGWYGGPPQPWFAGSNGHPPGPPYQQYGGRPPAGQWNAGPHEQQQRRHRSRSGGKSEEPRKRSHDNKQSESDDKTTSHHSVEERRASTEDKRARGRRSASRDNRSSRRSETSPVERRRSSRRSETSPVERRSIRDKKREPEKKRSRDRDPSERRSARDRDPEKRRSSKEREEDKTSRDSERKSSGSRKRSSDPRSRKDRRHEPGENKKRSKDRQHEPEQKKKRSSREDPRERKRSSKERVEDPVKKRSKDRHETREDDRRVRDPVKKRSSRDYPDEKRVRDPVKKRSSREIPDEKPERKRRSRSREVRRTKSPERKRSRRSKSPEEKRSSSKSDDSRHKQQQRPLLKVAEEGGAKSGTKYDVDKNTPTGRTVNLKQVAAPAMPFHFLEEDHSEAKGSVMDRFGPKK